MFCSVLQRVAVSCSVLQCGAVWCSVLQCVAVCCSVLQCVAVCWSVLWPSNFSCIDMYHVMTAAHRTAKKTYSHTRGSNVVAIYLTTTSTLLYIRQQRHICSWLHMWKGAYLHSRGNNVVVVKIWKSKAYLLVAVYVKRGTLAQQRQQRRKWCRHDMALYL